VKLLLDEHLSPKLARRLQDIFPGTSQVDLLNLKGSGDQELYQYAGDHQYVMVSKDDDFYDLALSFARPPKVVILRVGNVTTSEIETILRGSVEVLNHFYQTPDTWVCEILRDE
jgi:predicted nuclease of predicted toxin-antitoxin system